MCNTAYRRHLNNGLTRTVTWPEIFRPALHVRRFPYLAAFYQRHPIVYTRLAENAVKMVLDRTF